MKNIIFLLLIFYGCSSDSSKDIQKSKDNLETEISDSTTFNNENLDSLNIKLNNKTLQDSLQGLINKLQDEKNTLNSNFDSLNDINTSLKSKVTKLESDNINLTNDLKDINKTHLDLSILAENDNYKKYSKEFENSKNTKETSLIILFIVSGVCVILSTLISFYLYRWRRILSNKSGKEFIRPEDFDIIMKKLIKEFNNSSSNIKKIDQNITVQAQSNDEKISNMINTFMEMRKVIDEREAEIKRLKEGYDSVIYKKFLTRFIRVNQMVSENLHKKELNISLLERINNRLLDALEECEVETFSPSIGINYRDINQNEIECFFESPKEKSDEFKIFEIIQEGYKLVISDQKYEVIIPAQIKVYKQMEEV